MADAKTYRAFLSYASADRKTGKWLHGRLEAYRVPKKLRRERADLPKRLRPIFRDREELSGGGDLNAKLIEALDASEFLIVLCTPRAAASKWVNAEIAHFKATGRADRIIPVLAEGEPAEAFPPALTHAVLADGTVTETPEDAPLGADLREAGDGRRGAVLKITSGLLDVGFDTLRQRDVERRRNQVLASIALVGGILAMLFAAGTVASISVQAAIESDIDERRTVLLSAANEGERLLSDGRVVDAATVALTAMTSSSEQTTLSRFFYERYERELESTDERLRIILQSAAELAPRVREHSFYPPADLYKANFPYVMLEEDSAISIHRFDDPEQNPIYRIDSSSIQLHCNEVLDFHVSRYDEELSGVWVACIKEREGNAEKIVVLYYSLLKETDPNIDPFTLSACNNCLVTARGFDVNIPGRMSHGFFYGYFSESGRFLLVAQNEEMLLFDLSADPPNSRPISARIDYQAMGFYDPGTVTGRIVRSSELLVFERVARETYGQNTPTAFWLRLGGIEPPNFTMIPLNNRRAVQSAEGHYTLLIDRRGISIFPQGRVGGVSMEPSIYVSRLNYDTSKIVSAGLVPNDEEFFWVYTDSGFLEFYNTGIEDGYIMHIGQDVYEDEVSARIIDRYFVGQGLIIWVSEDGQIFSISRNGTVSEWRNPNNRNEVSIDFMLSDQEEICRYFDLLQVEGC